MGKLTFKLLGGGYCFVDSWDVRHIREERVDGLIELATKITTKDGSYVVIDPLEEVRAALEKAYAQYSLEPTQITAIGSTAEGSTE